jgi:putative peptide zinc metalloprotease protein
MTASALQQPHPDTTSTTGVRAPEGWRVAPLDAEGTVDTVLVAASGGRHWRVSPRTVELLRALEPLMTWDELATRLGCEWQRKVDAGLLKEHVLGPLAASGIVIPDAVAPEKERPARRIPTLLFRVTLVPERVLRPAALLAAPLLAPRAFWMACIVATVAAIAALSGVLLRTDVPVDAFTRILPAAIPIAIGSTFAHEWAHASACARFGGRHGALGFGLYLVFPVLYMELDDVWRLPREQRVIVDTAGMYAQMLCLVALLGAAALIPSFAPLACSASGIIVLMIAANLNPVFKFDGYWLASDLLGVPNLHRHARASLGRMLRAGDAGDAGASVTALPRGRAAIVSVYAAVAFSVFGWFAYRLLTGAPAFFADELPTAVSEASAAIDDAIVRGDAIAVLSHGIGLTPIVGYAVGTVLISWFVLNLLRQVAAALWRSARLLGS